MDPEDIRRLYRRETPAGAAEAAETERKARSDPDEARRFILTIFALESEDAEFARLVALFTKAAIADLIVTRAGEDDAFALRMAELLVDAMHQLKPPPRGRPKRPSTV